MTERYNLVAANDYIKRSYIDKQFYPRINFAAPTGWINDPNGFCIYNDEFHLFYQHYPYGSVHRTMHWGHAKSKDGLDWEHLDVALAPDQNYDKNGVFSGSAIEKDDKLYLMYTGHSLDREGNIKETQNIAISDDGIHFEKYGGNPVIGTDDIPEGSSISDFRDPKVFERNGKYYAVIGSKTNQDKGQVLLYESSNLLNWAFRSVIFSYNEYLGDMVECPDLIFMDDMDVFLLSAMNYVDRETGTFYPHISWLIEGNVNWETYTYHMNSIRIMDGGFDYYAPQTTADPNKANEYIAIAWHQAWNRTLPSHDRGHNWSGQMTLPRKLKTVSGKIVQTPYHRIFKNISKLREIENQDISKNIEISLEENVITFEQKSDERVNITFFNDKNESVDISFNAIKGLLVFSRENTISIVNENKVPFDKTNYEIPVQPDGWQITIFLDVSSIQIFVNNEYTFSSTYYVEKKLNQMKLESSKPSIISNLKLGKI